MKTLRIWYNTKNNTIESHNIPLSKIDRITNEGISRLIVGFKLERIAKDIEQEIEHSKKYGNYLHISLIHYNYEIT